MEQKEPYTLEREKADRSQSSRRGFRVTTKLISMVGLLILVLIGIQVIISIRSAQQQSRVDAEINLTSIYDLYASKVEVLEDASAGLAISLADRDDVKELFLAKDRDGLLELLEPLFVTLKVNYDIVHMYVHNYDGTVFLRVHDPTKYGDDIKYRQTAKDSVSSKLTIAGVEIGARRLGVRGVTPIKIDDELIGYTEIGLDYDQRFLQTLKDQTGADYKMWITNDAAAPAGLAPPKLALEAPIPELFYYAGTSGPLTTIPTEVYQRVLETGESEVWLIDDDAGTPRSVLVAPLLAYAERIIGVLEISQSRADAVAALQRTVQISLAVAAVIALITFVLLWIGARYIILRPLAHLTSIARRQTVGELSARTTLTTHDELEELGGALNSLSDEIEETLRNLEQMVSDRTRALETSTEVSRRLSTFLDQGKLVSAVVNDVQRSFDYYHVHIYLFDEPEENLVMSGGTGDAGRLMLNRGHKLPKGRGLVGRSAANNEIVLVSDTESDPGWLPNPLLPETKSEIAVPITMGDRVLGVLDVQDNEIGGLDEEDSRLLQSIANQVGIALQNAQLYAQTQVALSETRSLYDIIAEMNEAQSYKEILGTLSNRTLLAGADQLLIMGIFDQPLGGSQTPEWIFPVAHIDGAEVEVVERYPFTAFEAKPNTLFKDIPVILQDMSIDKRLDSVTRTLFQDIFQASSSIIIPLRLGDQSIGFVQGYFSTLTEIEEIEVDRLAAVASQAAIAVQGLILLEQAQARARQEARIRDVSAHVFGAGDVDTIMRRAVEQVGRVLGMPSYIQLGKGIEEK